MSYTGSSRARSRPATFESVMASDSVARNAIEVPAVGDAFQLVLASVLERESRSGGEVLDRGGCEYLRRSSHGADTCPDRDTDASNLGIDHLDLARMHTGANLKTEAPDFSDASIALRAAAAGPSKVAKNPSPAVLISRPPLRSMFARRMRW